MTWRFVKSWRPIPHRQTLVLTVLWLAACSADSNDQDGGTGSSAGDDDGSDSADGGSASGSDGSGGTGDGGSSGGTGSPSDTGGTGGTGSTGTTSDSGTSGETGETTTSSDSTTSGAYTCPPNPNFTCAEPMPCDDPGDMCGDVDSPFDEHGCLRPTCQDDADCEGTDKCYRPLDFGGCASSGLSCEDDATYGCVCMGTPDCSGAYCVPEEIYPG
jgi:hypothetical protein